MEARGLLCALLCSLPQKLRPLKCPVFILSVCCLLLTSLVFLKKFLAWQKINHLSSRHSQSETSNIWHLAPSTSQCSWKSWSTFLRCRCIRTSENTMQNTPPRKMNVVQQTLNFECYFSIIRVNVCPGVFLPYLAPSNLLRCQKGSGPPLWENTPVLVGETQFMRTNCRTITYESLLRCQILSCVQRPHNGGWKQRLRDRIPALLL